MPLMANHSTSGSAAIVALHQFAPSALPVATWTGGAGMEANICSSTFGPSRSPEKRCSKGSVPKPHSARISGARYWTRMGLSLETTASIGAWSDAKTLKHYIGAAVMTMRIKKELAGSGAATLEIFDKDLMNKMDEQEARTLRYGQRHRSGAGEPCTSDIPRLLSIVLVARRPKRWHQIKPTEGPASRWSTSCGEALILQTMTIGAWSERPVDEPICTKCLKIGERSRAV